jgi:hypothetical protein
MGLALIIVGLLVWFLLGAGLLGIILIILGVLLLFVPWDGAYGYRHYHGRGNRNV